jgi:hypothetical protein
MLIMFDYGYKVRMIDSYDLGKIDLFHCIVKASFLIRYKF